MKSCCNRRCKWQDETLQNGCRLFQGPSFLTCAAKTVRVAGNQASKLPNFQTSGKDTKQ